MTAQTHIAARRTTPHQPAVSAMTAWRSYFEQVRTSLPVADPARHDLEHPTTEAAFAQLAAGHPDTVTPADGGIRARAIDGAQMLAALRDTEFRKAHGAERGWSPQTRTEYVVLLTGAHDTTIRPDGAS
ncbi:hypothetical protein AB0P17_36430 [Streptomyces sp. NPDC088124]|uniref:hypothetical protein n=1 Tax=Streptomyces sp. NPDC088124 TaxID=3154654 RepID=UPI00343F2789